MSDTAKLVFTMGAFVGILMFILTVVVLAFAPAVLLIFGMWDAFAFWFPITMFISRFLFFFGFIIGIICVLFGKLTYFLSAVVDLIMAIWGVTVYQNAVTSLGFTQLSGLELQRTVLLIILIEVMTLSSTIVNKKDEWKDVETN